MVARRRVELQPAYLLHSYPWRETSLIVEVFSLDHGRVSLLAKGARRPLSAMRGALIHNDAARAEFLDLCRDAEAHTT